MPLITLPDKTKKEIKDPLSSIEIRDNMPNYLINLLFKNYNDKINHLLSYVT